MDFVITDYVGNYDYYYTYLGMYVVFQYIHVILIYPSTN